MASCRTMLQTRPRRRALPTPTTSQSPCPTDPMGSFRPLRLAAAASIAALMLPIGAAVAGAFNVSPVRVELSAADRTQALTVRNEGGEPSVVQVQMLAWSQDSGQDVLQPTTDLLVSPPV